MLTADLRLGPVGLWGNGRVSGTVAMQALRMVAAGQPLVVIDEKNTTEMFEKLSRDPRVSKGRGARTPWQLTVAPAPKMFKTIGPVHAAGGVEKESRAPTSDGEIIMPAESGLPRTYILGAFAFAALPSS
jgi:hypothetical protein